jgi:N-carbamoylputrescine amidase
MKTGLIQQQNTADTADNMKRLEDKIRKCAGDGAELIVLQELHNSLYFCQTEDVGHFDLAETIPGESTDRFGKLAKELNVVIVASLFEKRATGLYHNTAVVFENNGVVAGKYRKMHIPDDPAYYEKFYFAPGDTGFMPIETSIGQLGVLVCWDQWFPEAARIMALRGADLLIYPTAIGWESSDDAEEQRRQQDAWQTVQRGHAIANGLPVVAVNRVGHEGDPSQLTNGIRFWGHSFACSPQGDVIVRLSDDCEDVAVVEIEIKRNEDVRRRWPFLRDRRIDAYDGLTRRFLDRDALR